MIFLCALLPSSWAAQGTGVQPGEVRSVTFTDVDRHQHSTSGGRVTVLTIVTRKDEEKARMLGDRFPHPYLGDPSYELITVVNFQKKILFPFRGIALEVIRRRLDAEARELQKIYDARQLRRNARWDLFVAADFDGKIVSQLGIAPESDEFAVLVFDGESRLVRRWNNVPSAEALAAAMNDAR